MDKQTKKNKIFFGLGTVGRDMFYALEANALLYFLTSVMNLPLKIYGMITLVLTVLRIFDALNDPITGLIIDNVKSPWGKYKPPMLVGALLAVMFYLLLFADFGLRNVWYVVIFGFAYIMWDITYGINDIAYWSMMPSLSLNQKERESIGAFARICANIGMYIVMVGWDPITKAFGDTPKAWFGFAAVISIFMIAFQLFTIIGVKENKEMFKAEEKTTLKDMFHVLFANDQLMWTTLSMSLFTVGYVTTTSYAYYYMQYVFGDASLYVVLVAVVGVAQLLALSIFTKVSSKFNRKTFYTISTAMVIFGYLLFFFAEKSLIILVISAVIIFVGEAFIQTLMLMFLADTIEYGQWKLNKRNDSITFSIQPVINKLGGALSTGIVSFSLIMAGIKTADSDLVAESIDAAGKLTVKTAMLVIPLVLIVVGYIIYMVKYKIDEKKYQEIINDLNSRGDLNV